MESKLVTGDYSDDAERRRVDHVTCRLHRKLATEAACCGVSVEQRRRL